MARRSGMYRVMAFNHGDLDQDTADRLLAGRLTSDDAPPGYGGVAQLLQRAHVDTGLDVTDDELVVAMVNAIVAADPARTERNHVLTRIVTTKALVAAAVVALDRDRQRPRQRARCRTTHRTVSRTRRSTSASTCRRLRATRPREKSDHAGPDAATPANEPTETRCGRRRCGRPRRRDDTERPGHGGIRCVDPHDCQPRRGRVPNRARRGSERWQGRRGLAGRPRQPRRRSPRREPVAADHDSRRTGEQQRSRDSNRDHASDDANGKP